MKNLLLVTIINTLLLFSVSSWAFNNQFYLKPEVGTNKINNFKLDNKKLKQNIDRFLAGSLGYYVLGNVRLDLMLCFLANQQSKQSFSGLDLKIKSKVTTLMLNGYVDIFDISICEFFVGAGVGFNQLKSKVTTKYLDTYKINIATFSGKKNNLVYRLIFGAAMKLDSSVTVEVICDWKDFGNIKEIMNCVKSMVYKGHNVSLGIRCDI